MKENLNNMEVKYSKKIIKKHIIIKFISKFQFKTKNKQIFDRKSDDNRDL